ncbi:MAG: hypothetical protein CM15mP49_23450 [Actinomycetota bacterium]|nr:MAG: hypothetical protein CM15mP49_23450 [Actinomycetota bacterium]
MAGLLRDPYILQNLGAAMAKPFHDEELRKSLLQKQGARAGSSRGDMFEGRVSACPERRRNHPELTKLLHRTNVDW